MREETLTIRQSPFVFFKRLFWIQLLFALIPALVVVLGFREDVGRLPQYGTFLFNTLVTLGIVIVQTLLCIAAFSSWYTPLYIVNRNEVRYQRGEVMGGQRLADTQEIGSIEIRHGWVGRRYGYGTLILALKDGTSAEIHNIPDPEKHADLINELIDPEFSAMVKAGPQSVEDIIALGENQTTEFKASLGWDYHQQRINKDLHVPVMKNLVAFMNSGGGRVLIGVSDDGDILGLEPDLAGLHKKNVDGFENIFNMSFNKMIGVENRQHVALSFPEFGDKAICVCTVRPSHRPVYLNHKGQEQFYIRTGNASMPLSLSQATRYIQDRFPIS